MQSIFDFWLKIIYYLKTEVNLIICNLIFWKVGREFSEAEFFYYRIFNWRKEKIEEDQIRGIQQKDIWKISWSKVSEVTTE